MLLRVLHSPLRVLLLQVGADGHVLLLLGRVILMRMWRDARLMSRVRLEHERATALRSGSVDDVLLSARRVALKESLVTQTLHGDLPFRDAPDAVRPRSAFAAESGVDD